MATAYITKDSLPLATDQDWLVSMADDDHDGLPDTNVLEWACDTANGEIDSYVNVNPGLPIDEITPLLVNIAQVIAIYWLAFRRRRIPSDIQGAYDAATLKLEKLRDGEIGIGAGGAASGAANAISQNREPEDALGDFDRLKLRFPRIGHGSR